MKILLVIDNLGSGGGQRQLINLGVGLKNAGYEVNFLSYSTGNHFKYILEKENIRHIFINKNKHNVVSILLKISRLIVKGKYAIICAYLFRPSLIILLSRCLHLRFPKIVLSERSYKEANYKDIVTFFTRKLYPLASAIVANSKSQKEFLKTSYKRLSKKIYYIPNGVDQKYFSTQKISFNNKKLSILSIGHVNKVKNAKCLIECVNILVNQYNINLEVKWLGRDYDNFGKLNTYAEECYALVQKYNLKNFWSWEGRQQFVEKYLLSADILVHASYGEGFPNVICEALSVGCPVIASNVYDHPYVIQEAYNGFLFNPSNSLELANKLLKFMGSTEEEKRQMSENAKAVFIDNFTFEKMIQNYKLLFETIT